MGIMKICGGARSRWGEGVAGLNLEKIETNMCSGITIHPYRLTKTPCIFVF